MAQDADPNLHLSAGYVPDEHSSLFAHLWACSRDSEMEAAHYRESCNRLDKFVRRQESVTATILKAWDRLHLRIQVAKQYELPALHCEVLALFEPTSLTED